MARGVNKVTLIGNCGKDPDIKYFPSGEAVTSVTIATSESWKDKQSGEMQERTEWHKVVFRGRLAEITGEFLKKGSKVYVEGSIRTRSYDKDGQKHYVTEIMGREMQMLDGKGERNDDLGFDAPADESAARQQPKHTQSAQPAAGDMNDDIPF